MCHGYSVCSIARGDGDYLIVIRFLGPSSTLVQQNGSILEGLGDDPKSLGRQWALQAGDQILPKVDRPTLEAVQVCQVLGLFWFAVGEVQRHSMFTGPTRLSFFFQVHCR